MELKQIASFAVDHTKLVEGMYTSRIDGDVTTYDIRMVKPNCGTYLPYPAIHSFEHLFATYVRSSELSDQVMQPEVAIKLVNGMLAFIADFEGDVPGATEKECGNYREQDLEGAKAIARKMIPILKDWTPADCAYEK